MYEEGEELIGKPLNTSTNHCPTWPALPSLSQDDFQARDFRLNQVYLEEAQQGKQRKRVDRKGPRGRRNESHDIL